MHLQGGVDPAEQLVEAASPAVATDGHTWDWPTAFWAQVAVTADPAGLPVDSASPVGPTQQDGAPSPWLEVTFCTANVLTLRPAEERRFGCATLRRDLLAQQFHDRGFDVIGAQEIQDP